MTRVKQYPHFLFVFVTAQSYQDENGDFVTKASRWESFGVCREETNGKGTVVTLADGRQITYGALIQCPMGQQKIQEGASIRVCDDAEGTIVRVSGECLKSDVGQLHTRHWI